MRGAGSGTQSTARCALPLVHGRAASRRRRRPPWCGPRRRMFVTFTAELERLWPFLQVSPSTPLWWPRQGSGSGRQARTSSSASMPGILSFLVANAALEPILNRELEADCGLPLRWSDVLTQLHWTPAMAGAGRRQAIASDSRHDSTRGRQSTHTTTTRRAAGYLVEGARRAACQVWRGDFDEDHVDPNMNRSVFSDLLTRLIHRVSAGVAPRSVREPRRQANASTTSRSKF